MIELIEANWLLILLAVLVGFVVAWFLLAGSRKTKVTREGPGEDTGTKRNQALIDAPPAAAKDPAPRAASAPPAAAPTPAAAPAPTPAATSASAPAPAPVPTPRAEPAASATGGAGAAVGGAVARDIEAAQSRPAETDARPDTRSDAGAADDLTRLKGVGPKLAAQLNALGVTSFAQIASWNEADIDRIDDQLGRFKGRIRRDNWIEQAKLLASGDTTAYEARFGKL